MKAGHASATATLVCMGRAAAHEATSAARFSDPTALALLPEEARERVRRVRAGDVPKDWRGRFGYEHLRRLTQMMVVRTVAIDDAVREAKSPQLVILGAGLDGRAWRMPELSQAIVYEVDHPDSQRLKRERAASLTLLARELRFVPVDFTRDRLGAALAAAGHDPALPTTWVWEGVVMYLERADIAATLDALRARSAPGSRLVVSYHSPAFAVLLGALLVRRLGEPFRSHFRPDEFRTLLAQHGFSVLRDESLPELAPAILSDPAQRRMLLRHARVASAQVAPG
jgi:methyltransferase (TIGR00027 family)